MVKSAPYEILSGGRVFVDHSSDFASIKNQVAINGNETVQGGSQSRGVLIKGHYIGNVIFNYSDIIGERSSRKILGLVGHATRIKMGQQRIPLRQDFVLKVKC